MLLVDTPPGDITGQGTSTAQAKGLFSLRNHVRESNPEALDLSGMASPFNQMHIDHTRYLKPPTTSRGLLQEYPPVQRKMNQHTGEVAAGNRTRRAVVCVKPKEDPTAQPFATNKLPSVANPLKFL